MQLTQHVGTHPPPQSVLVVILFIISILFLQVQLRLHTRLKDFPPKSGDIVSWESAIGEHDGGAEREEAVEGLLLHLLQQHHPLLLFLPYLKGAMVTAYLK